MFSLLRRLRHGPLKRFNRQWLFLGRFYRLFIKKLGISTSVRIKIGNYGPFKLHPYFAFSNFENWNAGHNNGFEACIEACKGKKCVVDIGGHVGLVALPMSSTLAPNGKVFVFEPAAANYKYLNKHVIINKAHNISLYNCLIGDENFDSVPFYERDEATGMNSLVIKKDREQYIKTNRKQITLDSFFENSPLKPELIKIDVEGAEIKVLKGGIQTLKKFKPLIFLSVHPVEISLMNSSVQELRDLIKQIGYQVTNIDGTSVDEFSLKEYILKPI